MSLSPGITFLDYGKVRAHTQELCAPLKTEDYVPQPAEFTSPAKWHLAHTTWFFEQFILSQHVRGYQVFDPNFSFLFNSYYNNVGQRTLRAHRGLMTRPTVDEVYAYRHHVDSHMQAWLTSGELDKEVEKLVVLGLNHEQQHQELLVTDLKYLLGLNPIFPVYKEGFTPSIGKNNETGFATLKEGVYEIGHKGTGFHFDNEEATHKVYCQEVKLAKGLVTNVEFLEFIQAGGYEDFNLWLDEGWSWKSSNDISAPLYWHQIDGKWYHYTLSGLKELDAEDVLCHVSYYEACAYAEWKGMRLPTEFEWEAANHLFSWGQQWEWTQSAYLPYPGFAKAQGAVGEYNGKFMVNQMVLKGNSAVTSPGHSRPTYRNFFHPHFQWQFSGIRLAKK